VSRTPVYSKSTGYPVSNTVHSLRTNEHSELCVGCISCCNRLSWLRLVCDVLRVVSITNHSNRVYDVTTATPLLVHKHKSEWDQHCWPCDHRTPVVYGYGIFAILIQSETFSWTPYPIKYRKWKTMDSDIQSKTEIAHSVAHYPKYLVVSISPHEAKAVVILLFVSHDWFMWSCDKDDT